MADGIYTDLAKRCAAIVQEAIPECDARHYVLFNGGTFPYATVRMSPSTGDNLSDEIRTEDRTVQIRLIIGHLKGDYDGMSDERIGDYIDAVYDAFVQVPYLTSAAYPEGAAYLDAEGANLDGDTGLSIFDEYLGRFFQIGVEFTLLATLFRKTDNQE